LRGPKRLLGLDARELTLFDDAGCNASDLGEALGARQLACSLCELCPRNSGLRIRLRRERVRRVDPRLSLQ
jgi:hypothetical protein